MIHGGTLDPPHLCLYACQNQPTIPLMSTKREEGPLALHQAPWNIKSPLPFAHKQTRAMHHDSQVPHGTSAKTTCLGTIHRISGHLDHTTWLSSLLTAQAVTWLMTWATHIQSTFPLPFTSMARGGILGRLVVQIDISGAEVPHILIPTERVTQTTHLAQQTHKRDGKGLQAQYQLTSRLPQHSPTQGDYPPNRHSKHKRVDW